MNFSRQRRKILETLQNNVVHPSAEYIHQVLQKEHSKISLATVYRNLNKMAETGEIKKINGLEDSSHYDICTITFFVKNAEKFSTCHLIFHQTL